jgi:hypothetical protein
MAPGVPFCSTCGANVATGLPPGTPMMSYPMPTRTSGMAIAGFVLSFFCGLLGLIFSIMGRNECKRSDGRVGGGGLALAGIIISIVHLVGTVLYVVFVLVLVREAADDIGKSIDHMDHRTAQQAVDRIERAVPAWVSANPGIDCPSSVDDLLLYMDLPTTIDPWGNRYELQCGEDHAVVVISAGEDGILHTADDIKSR